MKARRTSVYRNGSQQKGDVGEYNNIEIANHIANLHRFEMLWEAYFKKHNIEPLVVSYDALVASKMRVISSIFEFLRHDREVLTLNPDLIPKRQYDEVSEDWYNKFLSDANFSPPKGELWIYTLVLNSMATIM